MTGKGFMESITNVNHHNLPALCKGSAFLGSGGGGRIDELRPTVELALAKWGAIPILDMQSLKDDDYIAAIILAGSPPPYETSTQPKMLPVLERVKKDLKKPLKAIMPCEVGGTNTLTPLCIAQQSGLPVLDADLMGRGFPEFTMVTPNLYGIPPFYTYIGNLETGEVIKLDSNNYEALEKEVRLIVQSFTNSNAILIPTLLTGSQAKQVVLRGTISRAVHIGQQTNVDSLLQVVQGQIIANGTIIECDFEIKSGFHVGYFLLKTHENKIFRIEVKNEYIMLRDSNNNMIVQAPDIITLLNPEDLSVIDNNQESIGKEVLCITCKGPDVWYTDEGLNIIRSIHVTETLKTASG